MTSLIGQWVTSSKAYFIRFNNARNALKQMTVSKMRSLTTVDTKQNPVGSAFCVPHFLFLESKLEPPQPSLSS